jgi:predicted esterase
MMKGMAREGYFLIAPDSAVPEGWSPVADGPAFMAALLDIAGTVQAIDRERMFLIGHSAGANHALWLGNQPDAAWRKIAVHAGAVEPRQIAPRTDAPAVTIVVGDQDASFPLDAVRTSAKALAEAGHDVELQVVPKHDHWFYIIGPRLAGRFAEFFRTP